MKMIIVALALVAVVVAQPLEKVPVEILRSVFEQQPQGPYTWSFESADGIIRDEVGSLKEVFDAEKKPHTVVVVKGSYTYTDSEGKLETINYFADENGYVAQGDSIPKPVQPVFRR